PGRSAPSKYGRHLNPTEFAACESCRAALEDELAQGVRTRARQERYTLVARRRVRLNADRSTRRGGIRVAARVVDEAGERRHREPSAPVTSDTVVLSTREEAAPESARRAYLLVATQGQDAVQFDLGGPLITIGRASDNDVIVDDPM